MTISDKKALAIIPARGGSKRIPRKNIKPFITAQRLSYAKSLLMENNVDCILPVTKFSYPIQVRVITSGTLNTLPKPTFKKS
jgi:hypothetical protein